jgi:hypothetical protein
MRETLGRVAPSVNADAYDATYKAEYDMALRQWSWNCVSETLSIDKRFEHAERLYNWIKTGTK